MNAVPEWRWAGLTLLGQRVEQQDALGQRLVEGDAGSLCLLAVADGHGVDGSHAARTAVEFLLGGDLRESVGPEMLATRFRAAHEALAKAGMDGGVTATLALLRPDCARVGWVGNSEARLLRRGGHLHTLTIPHEFGVHRGETRRLIAAGAEIVDPRSLWEVRDVEDVLYGRPLRVAT